jgi:hypothetical protein
VVLSRLLVIVALLVAIALAPAMARYVSGVTSASTPVFTEPTFEPRNGADPVPIEPVPAGDDEPSHDGMAPATPTPGSPELPPTTLPTVTTLPPSPRTPPAGDGEADDDGVDHSGHPDDLDEDSDEPDDEDPDGGHEG